MRWISLAGALLLAVLTSAASAATLHFSCLSGNRAADCQIGEAQLSVDVSDLGGGQVEFRFRNQGPAASAVAAVYFDAGSALDSIAYLIDADVPGGHPGVNFTAGSAAPGNVPSWKQADPDFLTSPGMLAGANAPSPFNGINPGEWLGIVFNLQTAYSFADLLRELVDSELRIALHVRAFASGGSESFISTSPTVVPLPAAGWLMGSALLGLGWLRQRLRAQPLPA